MSDHRKHRPDESPATQQVALSDVPEGVVSSGDVVLGSPAGRDTPSPHAEPTAKQPVESPAMARLRALVRPAVEAAPESPPAPAPSPRDNDTSMLAPPEGPGEIGRLGGYKVTKILGKGGMGMVLAAEDPRLGRAVALKVMLPELAASPAARSRFLQEARAAAAVEHDNIIPIWQVAEERGVPFLAMPMLSGLALEDALKMGRPLPLPMTLLVARQVAEGLAAAHAAGLIHRDIKPSNVWLEMSADGSVRRARILDFGLARLDRTDGDATELTKAGMILGTPAYMAPEQARALAVDARADLFSLGVVLYEMATGRRPFNGRDAMSVLAALVSDHPDPVNLLNPNLPPALADLIHRLLSKKPDDRPGSAAEVVAELKKIADDVERPASAPAPVSRWRRWWPAVAAGVLVALAAGGGAIAYAGTILRIVTNKGELVVESSDPDIDVVVKPDGGVVIDDRPKDRRFELTAGDGTVEFRDPATGAVATTERFRIERGGKTVMTAVVVPKKAAKPAPTPVVSVVAADPASPASRKALAAVVALGGKLVFEVDGNEVVVGPGQKIPDPPDRLRDVSFDGVQILTPAAVAPLADLPPVPGTLSLAESNASDAVLAALAEVRGFQATTRINLTDSGVTEDGLTHLARLPALSILLLEKLRVGERGLATVGQLRELRRLMLSGPGITATGLRHLRGLSLLNIDLREAPNVDDEAQKLLAEFASLNSLVLMRVPVTDAGVRDFARMPNLTHLTVSADGLTAASIDTVAGMKGLKILSLLGYHADPAALAKLSAVEELRMIDLSWAKLTAADLAALRGNKKLTILRVLGIPLTEADVKKLSGEFPQTRIEWDGGVVSPK